MTKSKNMLPTFLEHSNKFLCIIESYMGASSLQKIYLKILPHLNANFFWVTLAEFLNIEVKCTAENHRWFKKHSTIYYSNHPTGLIDGIAIANLLERNRIKFKIVVNSKILDAWNCQKFKEENFLGVDVYSPTSSRRKRNKDAIKKIIQTLKSGGNILIFPSGAIGVRKWGLGRTAKEKWYPTLNYLIEKSSCEAIPLYVNLTPSVMFSIASNLSKHLRYALIYRETKIHSHKKIDIDVGQAAIHKIKDCVENYYQIGQLCNA